MTDPFLIRVPQKLANDPELAPYFNFLNKVLHDLTTNGGAAIANPSGGTTIDTEARTSIDAILTQLRDGTIAT